MTLLFKADFLDITSRKAVDFLFESCSIVPCLLVCPEMSYYFGTSDLNSCVHDLFGDI